MTQFLDTQRIHNLIEYLEELHDHDKATADHTTLLLNCYAKLKDTSKLDSFIKAPGELKFDLETAIAMCRQGGYFEQAAYLATKHGENDMVVSILVEDSQKYAEALEFISRLEPDVVSLHVPNLPEYFLIIIGLFELDEICSSITRTLSAGHNPVLHYLLYRQISTQEGRGTSVGVTDVSA